MSFQPIFCFIIDGTTFCLTFLVFTVLTPFFVDEEMALVSIRSLLSVSPKCNIGIIIPSVLDFDSMKTKFLARAPPHSYEFRTGKQEFPKWNATQVCISSK